MTFNCMRGSLNSTNSMYPAASISLSDGFHGRCLPWKIAAVFCRDLLGSCGAAELNGFSVVFGYCVSRGLLTCSELCPLVQFTSFELNRQKVALQGFLYRLPWRLTVILQSVYPCIPQSMCHIMLHTTA